MNHHHQGPAAATPNSRAEIHEAIARRARELWEKHGKPNGQADTFWFQAEQDLVAERAAKKE